MNNKDLKIIKQIQAEAWGKFGDKLFVDKEKAPAVKQVVDHALTDERYRFSDSDLDKLQFMKDQGTFDGTYRDEDPEVAKEYEEYVESRIKEEIDKGTLTHPDRANKKAHQYARRNKRNQAGSDSNSEAASS